MNFPAIFAVGPFGPTEMMIVLVIVVLLFGAKKLPELARGLGKAKNEFQKASNEVEKELNSAAEPSEKTAEKAPPASTVPPGNN